MEEWPMDWLKSITIFKKEDAREFENYRSIALISHASKLLLKIILTRMESVIERESGRFRETKRDKRPHCKS